jgi:integrase/recombinase XerD
MFYVPMWKVEATKILTRGELAAVLADLKRKADRSAGARLNLTIFRLACCCGLRVSEIGGLWVDDVYVEGGRPHVRVRPETAKGHRGRRVPLWWDAGTLADLAAWRAHRPTQGAMGDDPFVCSPQAHRRGLALRRHAIRRRFLTACRVLGRKTLTIHHGRHTFVSHALAGGRTLAEVRDAAGHSNVAVTSAYLHVGVEDEAIADLFERG